MSLVQLDDIDLLRPRTLQEACDSLAECIHAGRKTWAIAGCTDWMVERRTSSIEDGRLDSVAVDVASLPELRGIAVDDDVMSIGAAEPYLAIRQHQLVRERCPLLVSMASTVGARQIQSRGTLGGNLVSASPAADGVTALFALDAVVVLSSSRGERTVPVTSFYTGYRTSVRRPDELVVRVSFRLPKQGALQMWRKVGTRKAQSISKVAVAAVAEMDADVVARIGFGVASVAEVVVPLAGLRGSILGKPRQIPDFDAFFHALDDAVDEEIRPVDDIRSTARYRRHVAKTLVKGFVEILFVRGGGI